MPKTNFRKNLEKNSKKNFRIALLTGGPSLERGISLNSARSVLDHLGGEGIEIVPIYFNQKKKAFKISLDQLYSNTPSDFDFKLAQNFSALTQKALLKLLKSTDIVFPAMHGPFGEDGQIQAFLEKNNIPFVGSPSKACKLAFDKFNANELIKRHEFFTLPSVVLKIYHSDHGKILKKFFKKNNIKRAIVKPASGGSSVGVFSVSSVSEALEKADIIFSKRMDTRVVVEPFAAGTEFTMIILENRFNLPVALPPTEIETDYTENQFFDFRRKYLPTRQVTWHCPPRFDKTVIEKIQAQGEQLFALLGMRDFSRFDGWVLPNGNIWFCDFNPISGMEQNSFLFQQASRIGMTHSDILLHIVKKACEKHNINFPNIQKNMAQKRKRISIIMGGDNSEKQVSLMSGTNTWLKLRHSKTYKPEPYLLDTKNNIWHLPYHLCLNHTVEEITENCKNYQKAKVKLGEFEERARLKLGLLRVKNKEEFFEPQKMTLKKFIKDSKFIFIALHGGDGENGNLQKMLKKMGVKFNGSDEKASRLCMDKWNTSEFIKNLHIKNINTIPEKVISTQTLLKFSNLDLKLFWLNTQKELETTTLIVKPRADGCTAGVVHLYSLSDLKKYLKIIKKNTLFVPKETFSNQIDIIEMPSTQPPELLFEKFIETDILRVKSGKLKYQHKTGWVEMTVGVVESNGKIKSFNPSITVVAGEVLTVEEKFQGGTGVNITPPPKIIISTKNLDKVKNLVELVAEKVDLQGYARIDIFVHVKTGNIIVIELNTLPGLTPSTVFYHQALAENPKIFPLELLEKIIKNSGY